MQRALGRLQPLLRAMSHRAHLDLSKYSSCEVSDALIKLGAPHGGHIPDMTMLSPADQTTRLCGPAYTVQMVLGSNKDAPKLSAHFVDTVPHGSVVVINALGRLVTRLLAPSISHAERPCPVCGAHA